MVEFVLGFTLACQLLMHTSTHREPLLLLVTLKRVR